MSHRTLKLSVALQLSRLGWHEAKEEFIKSLASNESNYLTTLDFLWHRGRTGKCVADKEADTTLCINLTSKCNIPRGVPGLLKGSRAAWTLLLPYIHLHHTPLVQPRTIKCHQHHSDLWPQPTELGGERHRGVVPGKWHRTARAGFPNGFARRDERVKALAPKQHRCFT